MSAKVALTLLPPHAPSTSSFSSAGSSSYQVDILFADSLRLRCGIPAPPLQDNRGSQNLPLP